MDIKDWKREARNIIQLAMFNNPNHTVEELNELSIKHIVNKVLDAEKNKLEELKKLFNK